MPFDSNGNFTRTQNWTSDYENGIEIVCDRHDDEDDNFANGFNQTFCRDGRTVATGNFKMGNYRITGLADAQTANDAVTKKQLDSQNSSLTSLITTEIKTTLSTIYPVGSVYIGTQATCPMASLISGSKWSLVSSGKALWTGNGSNANTTIEAGLPNITGNVFNVEHVGNISADGCFTAENLGTNGMGGSGGRGKDANIALDASKSSSIYGKSTTVQPPAYVVNVWRRTA